MEIGKETILQLSVQTGHPPYYPHARVWFPIFNILKGVFRVK